MPDFSLTLVLHKKQVKIINDMAKVIIKSEKITPFGGIFHVKELFSRYVGPVIDNVLGLYCISFGYQYSEIKTHNALIMLYEVRDYARFYGIFTCISLSIIAQDR